MKYIDKKAEEVKIAYIGGGSKAWARTLMNDLAKEEELAGTVLLYDIDYSAAKNNEIIGNSISATLFFWYIAVNVASAAFTSSSL